MSEHMLFMNRKLFSNQTNVRMLQENMMSGVRTYVTYKTCNVQTYITYEYATIFCPN